MESYSVEFIIQLELAKVPLYRQGKIASLHVSTLSGSAVNTIPIVHIAVGKLTGIFAN